MREYWIADRHQQSVTVLMLLGDRYEETIYRGNTAVHSKVFPNIFLTAMQILTIDEL